MSEMRSPNNMSEMLRQAQQQAAQTSAAPAAHTDPAKAPIMGIMNGILDSEGYRKRFDELLGARTPQFVSAIVSMVNGSPALKEAFLQAPATVVQAALKAATYDLPIDPGLGFAYIVPFRHATRNGNKKEWHSEAQFMLGYKGMIQLALRTGAYKTINVVEVKEGELKRFNRLTEDIELEFVEDEETRDSLDTIGYAGFYRLINGTEKTVYMTRSQIEKHELKHRKGDFRSNTWKDNFDAMACKTVLRHLIGKWGLMSVQYQRADASASAAVQGIMEDVDRENTIEGELVEEPSADWGDSDGESNA